MFAVAKIDYSRFREIRVGIYSLMIGSICLVLLFGAAARGSRRWIELPYFRFQPSELAKLLLIVALAAFVIERTRRGTPCAPDPPHSGAGPRPGRTRLPATRPRHGNRARGHHTHNSFPRRDSVDALRGHRWRGGDSPSASSSSSPRPPACRVPLHGYQQDRLTAFLHPSNDPSDASYQVNQSVTAIGSGEKTGRGDHSTQTKLLFLPERHTDFVFAVIGERFGFLGAAFVLSLYALLIWRMLRILTLSKNLYGTLIAGGIAAMLMFQILVNVGMTLGVMPVTGITLPLMSYGGSSVLVTFLAIGLLQSIHVQARLELPQQGAYPTVALSHLEHTHTDTPAHAAAHGASRVPVCSGSRRKGKS